MSDENVVPPAAGTILEALLGPDGAEVTCEQCFERLDEYVEHEHARAPADELVPGMRAHLQGCAACREEHDTLLALVRAER